MSNGQWPPNFAEHLPLWFVGGLLLLLLLGLFGPRRHDPVYARVSDGLSEVFAKMPNNHGERSAQRGLPPKHFLRLIRVAVIQRQRGVAKVRKRILQRLHRLGLVVGESAESFEIKAVWWRRTQGPGNAIVGPDDVRKDFTHGAHALAGTPGVLIRRHGLGQASVALLIVGNSFQELGSETGHRYSGRYGWSLMVGTLLRQAEWRQARAKYRKHKKIKTDTTHAILLGMLTPRRRGRASFPDSLRKTIQCYIVDPLELGVRLLQETSKAKRLSARLYTKERFGRPTRIS